MIKNEDWQEIWHPIEFDFEFTNKCRYEISNWGRVRSFNKMSNGNILKGSITEGYQIVRLKFFRPRTQKAEEKFTLLKKELSDLQKERRLLLKKQENPKDILLISELIEARKAELSQKFEQNLKKRTIHYHFLIHRMVAKYFVEKSHPDETIVGHLDFNKLNNKASNLKWMTLEENISHQAHSPNVIAEKKWRKYNLKPNYKPRDKGHKLTSTQVIHIKQLIKKKKPVKQIAKQFKISEMQVWRIKSGENWSHITIPQ